MTGTIIYDDQCRFCTRFANWCVKRHKDFVIMPVRDAGARLVLRDLGVQFVDLQTIYYIENGKIFVRSQAVFKILGHLKFPWNSIALFRFLPVRLTDFFYKLFAKYRYYV